MDYEILAQTLLKSMARMHRNGLHKRINESMYGEQFVLHHIFLHEGDILPGEISIKMGISAARITATLNSLEKKKLLVRNIDPNDRRRILIELTEQGRSQARENHQIILDNACNMLSELGEHDAGEYVRITGRLVEITQKHNSEHQQNKKQP